MGGQVPCAADECGHLEELLVDILFCFGILAGDGLFFVAAALMIDATGFKAIKYLVIHHAHVPYCHALLTLPGRASSIGRLCSGAFAVGAAEGLFLGHQPIAGHGIANLDLIMVIAVLVKHDILVQVSPRSRMTHWVGNTRRQIAVVVSLFALRVAGRLGTIVTIALGTAAHKVLVGLQHLLLNRVPIKKVSS